MAMLVLKLDEEKISREKIHDIEKMRSVIDKNFSRLGLKKTTADIYESDLGIASGAAVLVTEIDWLMENMSEFKLKYMSGNRQIVEDVLQLRAEGKI